MAIPHLKGKREFLAAALERTRTGSVLSATVARWSGLLVFNYHRIGDPQGQLFDHALFSATIDEFDAQVRFLKKHYDVIGVDEINDAVQDHSAATVMITFDDGYRDNFESAFPVLQAHNAQAVFFITSGFLDHHPVAWWDEISWMIRASSQSQLEVNHLEGAHSSLDTVSIATADDRAAAIQQLLLAFKTLPEQQTADFLEQLGEATGTGRCPRDVAEQVWMTWEMVREMHRVGMSIGAHTVTHPVLANCNPERQHFEVSESKRRIEQELGSPVTAFSYPVGQPHSFTEETRAILRDSGFAWGFSFYGGYCTAAHNDPFDLKRMPVTRQLPRDLFQSIARLPQIFARK